MQKPRPVAYGAVLFVLMSSFTINRLPGSSTVGQDQQQPNGLQLLEQTIKRTYAVNRLFYQVFNPGWEGANGAIGNAHLFAVTHDSSLLKLYTTVLDPQKLYNGGWVDDRAWVCLADMYWWDLTGRTNKAWVEDAKKRYLATGPPIGKSTTGSLPTAT
ncbi:MAG: hypothetical protein HW389_2973 [Bacteroidetes bacterium]|nr:hypothetical protein [Bacteroidota bacterium]